MENYENIAVDILRIAMANNSSYAIINNSEIDESMLQSAFNKLNISVKTYFFNSSKREDLKNLAIVLFTNHENLTLLLKDNSLADLLGLSEMDAGSLFKTVLKESASQGVSTINLGIITSSNESTCCVDGLITPVVPLSLDKLTLILSMEKVYVLNYDKTSAFERIYGEIELRSFIEKYCYFDDMNLTLCITLTR